ncbi:hypothetical protein Q763_16410 [Flavobacterium beibuense F44-8]|uniref:DUF6265 domain-containing protein n=1 Tax=Flavobacterium beibuense F44-8 TaxID=1406840 RepID=A0A0A2LRP0_9FLAO|nr:DUF6265 family protein [Flavobacterium beibuense]KGO78865.1 hypothetical protein Q763_16410 [Flavobacterium beibuense F44-8]
MKQQFILITAVGCLLFTACKENRETKTKTYTELEKAEWVLGQWVNKSHDAEFSETWMKENDSVYAGESYFIRNSSDTLFAETMKLAETNGKLNMIITVPNQNDEKPVGFEMTSANDTLLVFENPAHDFPTKITYRKVNKDSLLAEISGLKEGETVSQKFPFKRR